MLRFCGNFSHQTRLKSDRFHPPLWGGEWLQMDILYFYRTSHMKKFFKIIIYSLLLLITLAVLGSFLAIRFVDPNNYKGRVTALVQEKTGYNLAIQGPLALSFFPWVGIRAQDVELANASGFTPSHFIRVGEANIRVKLLPLLSRQVEMGRVTLKNVDIHLTKNKQGICNWQNIGKKKASSEETKQTANTATAKPTLFSIAGVDIENASLSWTDAQKNKTLLLKNMYIKSEAPKMDMPFPMQIVLDMQSTHPNIKGHVTFNSNMLVNKEKTQYTLQNPHFIFTAAAKNAQPVSLQAARLFADISTQSGLLEKGTLSVGDLRAQFSADGKGVLDNPVFQGRLDAPAFNAKKVLQAFGGEIITADPNALQKVALSTQFSGTASSIQLNPLAVDIDHSKLEGKVEIKDFAAPAIRFDLDLDQLNVDNYLPPKSDQAPATPETNTTPPTTEAARVGIDPNSRPYKNNLNLKGNLRIDRLNFSKTGLNKVVIGFELQNGLLTINPFNALLYKGSMKEIVAIDFMHSTPSYILDGTLSDIDMAELVPSKRLTGKANLETHLTTMGRNKAEILRHLNGQLRFNIQKGALMGINLPYQIERAIAVFKKQPAPAAPASADRTDFDLLQGTGTFAAGLFTNNDLQIQSPQFKGTGQGTAHLVTEGLHYQIQFVGLQGTTDAQGKITQEERRTPIPVLITGTFEKPIITPDLQVLLQGAIGEEVIHKVQEKLGPDAGHAVEGILNLLKK
jgi:AsmA protein